MCYETMILLLDSPTFPPRFVVLTRSGCDNMPSFDLGLSQHLPSTQELVAMREETLKNVEPEADVGGKGKSKKEMSKYGKSPFLLRVVDVKT
ncbi:hypothetical protein Hanom_Chr01g00044181 [Helianthus anomalus]